MAGADGPRSRRFLQFRGNENLLGLRLRNADRLHPEWQRLDIGDVVRLTPKGWMGLRNSVALRVVDRVATFVVGAEDDYRR